METMIVQFVIIIIALVIAVVLQKKLSLHSAQTWSYWSTYCGTMIGIGSVVANDRIGLGGYPPVILVWKYGPQLGVGLVLIGLLLQLHVHHSKKSE
ncbi:hypothetical protein COW95_01640 [Candidatus Peregrinibacteria bacterium CG22_combo_CG10-13_8_21_14_all_49_11]|nr:MAG: hypothetical protein COW95_01640 [Candidatus Peregrinibacteria bacterium CG22_combo_CG10-13_8_21_14_all_49_11]